jgi:hypothetical protein
MKPRQNFVRELRCCRLLQNLNGDDSYTELPTFIAMTMVVASG